MTLIFDWDGTLHNTLHLYGRAFRAAYADLVRDGYAPARAYSDEDVSVYLGMNASDMWNAFMPQLPENVKTAANDCIGREMARLIEQGEAVLYDGVPEVLDALKARGHTLVFLSNCKHDYQEAHRRYFGLDRWFSGYYCCEDYGDAPKEEIFLHIARRFPGTYTVIGDRASDFKVAQVHGLRSIGCAYGFGTAQELQLADVVVQDCREIPHFVLDEVTNR